MTIFQLSGIIKNNPWNIPIILKGVKGENTEKEMLVTPEALERIKDLLNHS